MWKSCSYAAFARLPYFTQTESDIIVRIIVVQKGKFNKFWYDIIQPQNSYVVCQLKHPPIKFNARVHPAYFVCVSPMKKLTTVVIAITRTQASSIVIQYEFVSTNSHYIHSVIWKMIFSNGITRQSFEKIVSGDTIANIVLKIDTAKT